MRRTVKRAVAVGMACVMAAGLAGCTSSANATKAPETTAAPADQAPKTEEAKTEAPGKTPRRLKPQGKRRIIR